MRLARLLVGMASALALAQGAWAADVKGARAVFEAYEAYTAAYDPRIVDLYAPDAVVVARKGAAQRTFRGPQWQALIRAGMPVAKARKDLDSFQAVRMMAMRDGTVEIKAVRYNHLRNYSSPYRAVLKPGPQGWRIVREEVVVKPS
jgi:hypothetical protein